MHRKYTLMRILLCVFCVIMMSANIAAETVSYSWQLRNGTIIKASSQVEQTFSTKGKIKWFSETTQGVFYISVVTETGDEDSKKRTYFIGMIDKKKSEISFEKEFPFNGVLSIKKCIVRNGAYYLIVKKETLWLYTINYSDLTINKEENILDFEIVGDRFFYIKPGEKSYVLMSGRESLPVNLKGDLSFKSIIGNRLIILENSDGAEVIDIKKMKSIYVYSQKNEFLLPDTFNLVIEAVDQTDRIDAKNFVFYKVFIDGVEKGRTSTGLPKIKKIFKNKFGTGKHIVQLERWKLLRARKMYKRENNIHQPRPFELIIPENRVVKLKILYDGKTHKIVKIIVRE